MSFSAIRLVKFLGVIAAASLGLLAGGANAAPAADRPAAATSTRVAEQAAARDAWRTALLKAPRPKKGCFHASYPSMNWLPVACVAPPRRSYDVGHGIGFSAKSASTITTAIGSFDAVNGVTSETGGGSVPDSFSLQLNSSFFSTQSCNGAEIPANCQGWQQFIYSNTGSAFIEYWLIHWGNVQCPMGWTSQPPSCFINSPAVAVPPVTIAALAGLSLLGSAGSGGAMDGFAMSTGGDVYIGSGDSTLINLAPAWNYAEFNVFGDGGGATATFNAGSNLIVRTAVNDSTQNAPVCQGDGISSEKNSYTLVTPCCPYAGVAPAIVFDESNNVGATSMCSGGTSIGDTHLTNVNGLYYDFQAAGDFLLAETNAGFVVQTRQKSGAPNWPNATLNKAVALQLGHNQVALCLEPNRFVIDGKPAVLGDGKTIALPGGDSVSRKGDSYTFMRANGENVVADLKGLYINVTVGLGHVPVARVHGLLGNANGNAGPDDLAARGGAVLAQPVSFDNLYHLYGDSWRVPPAQSLPAQLCGDKGTERANPQRLFTPADLEPKLRARTREVCQAAGVKEGALLDSCMLDTAVLGDRNAARVFAGAPPPRAVLRPPPKR